MALANDFSSAAPKTRRQLTLAITTLFSYRAPSVSRALWFPGSIESPGQQFLPIIYDRSLTVRHAGDIKLLRGLRSKAKVWLGQVAGLMLGGVLMTTHPHASPLTLLFFRLGIAVLAVPILALTLYGQAFYGSVAGTITDQPAAALSGVADQLLNRVPGMYRTDAVLSQAVDTLSVEELPVNGRNITSFTALVPGPDSISEFRVHAGLAIAIGRAATHAQVIHYVPNVTQNPLSYAMLQNGVQPHNETSTSTLGDL
jgi:hypothetical protein